MADASFLQWPFFEPQHLKFRAGLAEWAAREVPALVDHHDADASCKRLVKALGQAGWLEGINPAWRHDLRRLCLARETLAFVDGLADFAFAMQGLGTGPIALFGTPAMKARILPRVAAGEAIAAFALSETEAGSDVAAMTTTAAGDGNAYRLDGEKMWISNGGIADHYIVFARTGEAPGAKGISAFLVEADAPGLIIDERIEVMAPHPLARLRFEGCRVPDENRIGAGGEGFRIAMATLDLFRTTVGAAALGFARRALDEALTRITGRQLFGRPMSELPLAQADIGEMATAIDAAALLIYRAAHARDSGAPRITREASMAKMFATEAAQRVIDKAVQMHGGVGVRVGSTVERLYREIRALRIYEGATEVQKLVIARETIKAFPTGTEG
jgi:acyl-CoA dehydrogenase